MGFDPSIDSRPEASHEPNTELATSVKNQVVQLLMQNSHRWYSPYEVGQILQARSAPRRMREVMEADRDSGERRFEEKEVRNTIRPGRHKVYRWRILGRGGLF